VNNTISGRLKLYDAKRERARFVTIALVRGPDGAGLVIRPDDATDLAATRLGDGPYVPLAPDVMAAIVTALGAADGSEPTGD